MPSGFDTKELTVLTWLDNIIALAEAGDESAWTRIADLWAGRHGVGGLSRHDAIALLSWLERRCPRRRTAS